MSPLYWNAIDVSSNTVEMSHLKSLAVASYQLFYHNTLESSGLTSGTNALLNTTDSKRTFSRAATCIESLKYKV